MFSYLSGTITHGAERTIHLEVQGVGFLLQVPDSTVFPLEKRVHVFTHMVWNQEQGPSLFGFISELEKTVFTLIISCSGIGPKIALATLAELGAQGFLEAIHMGDEKRLSKVSGIGAKKAEQIIVHLKHKVARLIESGVDLGDAQHIVELQTLAQALESLNYSRSEINNAMQYVQKNYNQTNSTFDTLLRQALSYLTKQV